VDVPRVLWQAILFALDNWEAMIAFAGIIVSVIRLTKWGRANEKALVQVMQTVEHFDAKHIKAEVAAADVPPAVRKAIEHGTNVVDPKKMPDPARRRLLQILLSRGQ
jgi:hypothetical protein